MAFNFKIFTKEYTANMKNAKVIKKGITKLKLPDNERSRTKVNSEFYSFI